jgi:UDP-N-acetylmuramyl pentapeptide phosphotransferase/UDP-N-acetylglucosamine-1-phosphate transferase
MSQLVIHGIIAFVVSMLGTAYLVPKIIAIVRFKKLMDNPNERSSHSKATPSLGGMAFFIVLVLSMYFNHPYDTHGISISIFPALTILFFLGIKDDLVVLSPITKLIGQSAAALFILANIKFEINSLHGFFGIGEINEWIGIVIGLFLILAIINAFNLIDGIDGLASSVGIVAFSGFAVVFFLAGRYFFGMTSIVMVGILTGFLFFNLSTRNKIFMGDTGSMLVGFMLGMMSVRFLALDYDSLNHLPFNAIDIPIIIISFLIVPLFDTGRVFTIRLLNGKGLFTPDRNHLHHVVIDAYNISHRRASFFIALFNIVFILVFSLALKTTDIYVACSIIVVFVAAAAYFLHRIKTVNAIPVLPQKKGIGRRRKTLRQQRNLGMRMKRVYPYRQYRPK